jgi:hypothetical protein
MAKIFVCRKCGSIDLFIKENGPQVGLYCKDCGAWQKWIGKDERRLVEMQLSEQSKPKKTNFDSITESPNSLAEILIPMLPTMEGFCEYCKHWIAGECQVNPNWDCKNALINWLNQPKQEEITNA